MWSDTAEVSEIPPSDRVIKVHHLMCMELSQFVTRVSVLLPEIEAARPGCSSGREALCRLNIEIDKAKTLRQHCTESSKLYLALTGDSILSRCEKSRNLFEQSLSQVQNMVPVSLAAEISQLIAELRGALFSLDPSEEEAGKVLKELLRRYVNTTDSAEEHAYEAIQVAMWKLHITSLKDLSTEKRSIKKLLDREGEGQTTKRRILSIFLKLLNKHGKSIVTEQTENGSLQQENSYQCEANSRLRCRLDDAEVDVLRSSLPPDEFKCPLSLRLMYEPVVIASGQTYERFRILKWFAEGNDTCPTTRRKLANLSLTPNHTMKDLISRWSATHGVSVPDPSMEAAGAQLLESRSNSIASLSSSMNNLVLPIDFSNLSHGSSDAGHVSYAKRLNNFDTISEESNDSIHKVQFQDMDLNPLTRLSSLSWGSQCILVGKISNIFKYNDQACNWMSSEDFVPAMIRFLKDAHDLNDLNSQILGCLSLSTVLQKCRSSLPYLNDDTFALLVSFLGTEVSKEALSVLKVLSCHQYCQQKIVASGALTPILEMLDDQNTELHEPAIKILCNLSGNSRIVSFITPSDVIPKLIPFLEDTALARDTLIILKNLCITEAATTSVAETNGCIPSIVKLLDSDSLEDQEHAVDLLLSLCSQCVQYCQLVIHTDERVFSDLANISLNGNSKGKALALELLSLFTNNGESSLADADISKGSTVDYTRRKSSSKALGLLRKLFSKQGFAAKKIIMWIDVHEVSETPPSHHAIKVHHQMCMELIQFVTRVSVLLTEIEAARPGCSSGREALCRLNSEIDKAKTLHQHCSESSKLYLAFTGDTILSRCKKSRNLFEQSLSQVQNMVPASLAAEISQVIVELRGAIFSLDPSEEEAGKVIKELLHRYVNAIDSAEEYAFEAIQVAMWKLHITSLKPLSIEKRSIKEMMDRVGEGETTKRRILSIFLKLLNKHGKSIVIEQTNNGSL